MGNRRGRADGRTGEEGVWKCELKARVWSEQMEEREKVEGERRDERTKRECGSARLVVEYRMANIK
jgi:hypothetical protein